MRIRRIVTASLLFAATGVLGTSLVAVAQDRGGSGLPSGAENPLAILQRQIDALSQRINGLTGGSADVSVLTQQIAALKAQTATLMTLQQTVDQLSTRVTTLESQLTTMQTQLAALGQSDSYAIFDDDGKKIGNVAGVQDSIPWVALTASGRTVALRVFSGQLIGGVLWYSGSECSGDVYIADTALNKGADIFSVAAVQEPGGVVYAAELHAVAQPATVQSVREHDGSCQSFASAFSLNLVSAVPIVGLDTLFKRPYGVH